MLHSQQQYSNQQPDLNSPLLSTLLSQPSSTPQSNQQSSVVAAKAYHAFNNALPSPTPSANSAYSQPTLQQQQQQHLQQQQKNNLLGALNGGGMGGQGGGSGFGGANQASSMSASAILASLNGNTSNAGNGASHSSPPSSAVPSSQSQSLDPWSANSTSSSVSHLPSSISQSINNPGLPSGVIVSSAAVNAMSMNSHGSAPSSGPVRSETPGVPGSAQVGQGGKLLLGAGAGPVTSSLIQPGSVPGNGQGQSENEKVYYLIVDLMSPNTREGALLELSKKREQWDDLALVLWHSFGTFHLLYIL